MYISHQLSRVQQQRSVDGEDIADMETFHDKIVACNPGDKVTIVYYRNNNGNYEKQTATATLKEKQ